MTRAGWALRDKWAMERRWDETERRMPGYHARHWGAGKRKTAVMQRYVGLLLSRMSPEDALPLLMAAQSRLNVVEHPGGIFVVTTRRTNPNA